jgi:hypothetical protein
MHSFSGTAQRRRAVCIVVITTFKSILCRGHVVLTVRSSLGVVRLGMLISIEAFKSAICTACPWSAQNSGLCNPGSSEPGEAGLEPDFGPCPRAQMTTLARIQ